MASQINNINISYKMEDFMKYKDSNIMLPANLKLYCNDLGGNVFFREGLTKEVSNIIDSFLNGKNPNDIIFKNSIIEALNNITQRNYQTVITTLKSLNFSKAEHFITLSTNILICAMTDITGVKGIDIPSGQISSSEIFVLILSDFFPLILTDNEKKIKFSSVFLDLCKRHFDDFCDPLKPLDLNNLYRVDNFKGFTNFLGILNSKCLINNFVINDCIVRLINLIFNTSWGQIESENVYEGYRRIFNNIIKSLEKKTEFNDNDIKFINKILENHIDITNRNKIINKLRRFTMMCHTENEKRIQKLVNSIKTKE